MAEEFDIIVIGAGPAGMSAAIEASNHGADVCLLDEQSFAGGQIYRDVENASKSRTDILGRDYLHGRELVRALQSSKVIHRKNATIWRVSKNGNAAYSIDGLAFQVSARHIIIANGALERPVPFPGWTTPGVMTAGAAQILLKSTGIAPAGAVLIGTGPLMYLVATQLISASLPPKALIETQSNKDLLKAMRYFLPALRGWKQLVKGTKMLYTIRKAGVQRFQNATDIKIHGTDAVKSVGFSSCGKNHEISTNAALVHQGVVPNTQISRSLGLEHKYNHFQHCFAPEVDELGQSSNGLYSIAGDGAGIGGALAAEISGKLCALNALCKIEKITSKECAELAQPFIKKRKAELAIRPFLDVAYPPSDLILNPADETIICRCESVKASDIRKYAELGCKGPNQTKAYGRSGMGPCQGRFCSLTVTEILAKETSQTQDQVGSYRIRAPLKPVTLKEMASLSRERNVSK